MVNPNKAAEYLLQVRAAEQSFEGFVRFLFPTYRLAPFQLEIIKALDDVEKGKIFQLMINMPPRHGKSFLCTELFPVYYIARFPKRKVLSASYNEKLAKGFGRRVRNHALDERMRQAFPDFQMSDDSSAADLWHTTDGGQYAAVGLGGTTSGMPANLLVLDDPIKNRKEADSYTKREDIWEYYTQALSIRKEPIDMPDGTLRPAAEIMILTRWHDDDPAGRVQKSDEWGRWVHLTYPGIIRAKRKVRRSLLPKDDPLYLDVKTAEATSPSERYVERETEQSLWPERFSLDDMRRTEKRIGSHAFAALYGQSPYIKGGNIFKEGWWRRYEKVDHKNNKTYVDEQEVSAVCIAVDTAFKTAQSNDFSVFLVMALLKTGDIAIIDVKRGKWEFPELKRLMLSMNGVWRGKGLRAFYVEDKASGQSLIQEMKRETGISVIAHKVAFDKTQRANSVTPLVEGGRVLIPKSAPWLDDFMQEMISFPNGVNDDQVDAFVIAVDRMSRMIVPQDFGWESALAGNDQPLGAGTKGFYWGQ